MNCQIFETVVNDLAREQMMEANARHEALDHSGNCEACELRLALERRLTFGLRALVEEMTSLSASARVEEELREAFRMQTSLLPQTRPATRSRYWLVAAAAVVLIAFGIAGMKLRIDGSSQPAIETIGTTGVETPVRTAAVAPEHSDAEPEKRTKALYLSGRKPSVRNSMKQSADDRQRYVARGQAGPTNTSGAGNSEETEVTTQFLPLSYTSPVNLQDGGQLVRVELPRSTMARLGLPVNIERSGERVKADVLVSVDGLARAIRFVQ